MPSVKSQEHWSIEQEQRLLQLRTQTSLSWPSIALLLKRSGLACKKKHLKLSRLKDDKVTSKNQNEKSEEQNGNMRERSGNGKGQRSQSKKWSQEEIDKLLQLRRNNAGWSEIGEVLGRTRTSCNRFYQRWSHKQANCQYANIEYNGNGDMLEKMGQSSEYKYGYEQNGGEDEAYYEVEEQEQPQQQEQQISGKQWAFCEWVKKALTSMGLD